MSPSRNPRNAVRVAEATIELDPTAWQELERIRRWDRLRRIIAPWLMFLAVWGIWELCYYTKVVRLTFFPPPSKFLAYAIDEKFSLGLGPQRSNLGICVLYSFFRVSMGLLLAFVSAVSIGILASVSHFFSRGILPFIRFLAPIAPIGWIPLVIALLGIGNSSAIALVFIGTFPILVIATVAAIQRVDPELLKTAASLGATGLQRWMFVILPAALPSVFTILRINFIAAWMALLAAEMVGLHDGLGMLIEIGRQSADPNLIMVALSLIAVCGYIIDSLLLLIQRQLLWWERGNEIRRP